MSTMSTPFIDTESFFLSPDISATSRSQTDPAIHLIPAPMLSKLKNLGPARLRDMRSQNTSMQIVSHLPIDASTDQCQKINDALAGSIVMNQDRLAGLALLTSRDAHGSAEELGRCVTKHRFVGGVLPVQTGVWEGNGFSKHAGGVDKGFEELWKVAQRYRVPVVLRPVFPCNGHIAAFEGLTPDIQGCHVPTSLASALVTNFYTTHAVSPVLLLRLYLSGAFDRHPNLRLVLSQDAHSIPRLLPRIQSFVAALPPSAKPARGFLHVWQHNIYATTADTLDVPGVRALLEQIPIDRVLFAGNYP